MTKPSRSVPKEEALSILKAGKHGVLSTATAQGEPYGVPVNYCYSETENCIFFHCARAGKKLDNIAQNEKVSFVVIGYESVVPERFITHYESVVVTGRAHVVTDTEDMNKYLLELCKKFAPDVLNRRDAVIQKYMPAVVICKVSIDAISGKRNNDL
jgi:uncharacterized protein